MAKSNGISKGFTIRQFFIDNTGNNYLMVKQNDKIMILSLKLAEKKIRLIGQVTKSTKTIEMKRKREKHLFRKLNAYGFNDYVLRNQNSITWVRLSDDLGNNWKIPVNYILDNGEYLNFREKSFELQRFVSLENLEQFRVHKEENRRI